jgi:CRISPR/Cas system-associated exonuclease Cas4 (RecB family)
MPTTAESRINRGWDNYWPHTHLWRITMKILNEPRPHFSVSQLTDYLNCPLAYRFRHVLGLAWGTTPRAVAFGASVHKSIEYMNKCLANGRPDVTADDVVTAFNRDWAHQIKTNNINWKKADEAAELLMKGQELLETYWQRFHDRRYTAVELGFRLPILDPSTGLFIKSRDVVGRIDAIDGGTLVEVKTSGRTPNQYQVDADLQLTLYSWAYRFLYGKAEDKIQVVYLVKTKEPKLEVLETHRDPEDHTKLISLMEQVIRAIDQRLFYPNPVGGYSCGTCGYRAECKEQWPL